MRVRSLEVVACPSCFAPLEAVYSTEDPINLTALRCTREGLHFLIRDGVPTLVRPDRVSRVESFAASYSRAWQKDGWGSRDEAYLLNLPYHDTNRRRQSEWLVKARSMEVLFRILNAFGAERIVDLGCGVGWLAYRLALGGRETYAVDIVRDDRLGLAAAEVYLRTGQYFERICAEIDRLPFLSGSIDAVICNASLHYATQVQEVVSEAARVLRPGGVFVVMNSPVYLDEESAKRAERDFRDHLGRLGANVDVVSSYNHFTRQQLETALSNSFGRVLEAPFDPGKMFRWTRRVKGIVLGMELASFPILYATNELPGSA